jgi:hypothetical protein
VPSTIRVKPVKEVLPVSESVVDELDVSVCEGVCDADAPSVTELVGDTENDAESEPVVLGVGEDVLVGVVVPEPVPEPLGVFCALTIGLMMALLWHREGQLMATTPEAFDAGRIVSYGDLFIVGVLQWLKFGVLAAIVLLIASFSNTNLYTVVTGFFALVICHLQYLARDSWGNVDSLVLRSVVRLLSFVFPNFQLFNLSDEIGQGAGLDPMLAGRVALYAVVYIAVIGSLAVYSFRNREI